MAGARHPERSAGSEEASEAAPAELPSTRGANGPDSHGLVWFEVVWIFLLFFLFAGSAPPDVGESHYLVKAKHYWQPEWCSGDLFVESRDAHAAFYWTFGWVTQWVSLTAAAWIGRVVTWLWLAWTWHRLSRAIVPRPLMSILSAGLVLVFLRHFHMAGEWIVGGVEAKGFAYGFVFLSLASLARGRWPLALVMAGAAGGLHVLVGGWLVVAIGLAWLMPAANRPPLVSLLPAAVVAFVFTLPGLLPALTLNAGVPADVQRAGARLYVFERLAHHLVLHRFEAWHVVRFQLLVAAWGALAWALRKRSELCAIHRVVTAAIGIAVVGAVIDQWFVWQSERVTAAEWQPAAASLLRYYWYRLADALVPLAAALGVVAVIERLNAWWPAAASAALVTAMAVAGVNLADIYYWRSVRNVPPAVLQPRPTPDALPLSWFFPRPGETAGGVTAEAWFRDWRSVGAWIGANTRANAVFLTPREQQTFKWYAGRAEVVNWKDVPQDARGLVEWKQRMNEVYPRDKEHREHDLAAFSDEELLAIARKYDVRYIVLDKTRAGRRLRLPRIYPLIADENRSFEVYVAAE